MAGNALTNAGGLDGVTGWTAVAGAALSATEAGAGGPGRGVLLAAGNGAAAGVYGLVSAPVATAPGQVMEAYGGFGGFGGVFGLVLVWRTAGGAEISRTPIPQVADAQLSPTRGLPASFARGYLRAAAPDGAAQVALQAQVTQFVGGAYTLALLKPFLAAAPADTRPTRWDPGLHVNPDLQLAVWPPALPPFRTDGLATPIANAKSWAPDSGIPVREALYSGLHHEFRGQMRLSLLQWDALDAFYTSAQDAEFYVVRPETDQLCVAEWLADGAPKPVSVTGPWIVAEVGLHLRIA